MVISEMLKKLRSHVPSFLVLVVFASCRGFIFHTSQLLEFRSPVHVHAKVNIDDIDVIKNLADDHSTVIDSPVKWKVKNGT